MMRWTVPAAAALHALVLMALLVRFAPGVALAPASDAPTIEIQYVEHPAAHQGAPPAPQAQPAADPVPPQPDAPPQQEAAALPPPTPPPRPPSQPAEPQPSVNLGDADQDLAPLKVTGDNVVETAPDARYRNMPPDYPLDAARRREEGKVSMVIHVSPTGAVDGIDVTESSGSEILDRSALTAVRKWHFTVPIKDGVPIASTYEQSFNFIGH